jgi:thiamine-phosphate pyrophosphorylase
LHVIVNPTVDDPQLELASAVLGAGAPLLQVRVKAAVPDRVALELVGPIVEQCHASGARAVVNDRADLCVASGADGVHGGADDLPVEALRMVVRPTDLVGGTARDPRAAKQREADGADYVGVGPVYATTSKGGLPDPIGPDTVAAVAAAVGVPVIAIGGVTAAHVRELVAAGAHGVAVIGAVAHAADPASATRELLEALGAS